MGSPDGFDTAFKIFPWIFGAMVVLVVCGWITTAVIVARNGRVFRQAGIDPTTAGAQLAVRVIRGQAARPSTSSRLAELGDLRDRGLITPDEYEARRAQIIADI
jgi:Short C-terminal domain